jgi:hypothetical protein
MQDVPVIVVLGEVPFPEPHAGAQRISVVGRMREADEYAAGLDVWIPRVTNNTPWNPGDALDPVMTHDVVSLRWTEAYVHGRRRMVLAVQPDQLELLKDAGGFVSGCCTP